MEPERSGTQSKTRTQTPRAIVSRRGAKVGKLNRISRICLRVRAKVRVRVKVKLKLLAASRWFTDGF